MEESGKKNQERTIDIEIKTFPVPFAFAEITDNITISTNTLSKSTKEKLINQAFSFHSKGKILEAIKYYKYCLNQGIDNHKIFSNYGAILKGHGNLKEAEILIRKAIKLKPDYAIAYSNLGSILIDIGNLKEAELFLRKAIEIDPNLAESHYNLGIILKDFTKLDESILSLMRAIELKSDFKEAIAEIGLIMTMKGNYKEGLKKIKEGYGTIVFDHIIPAISIDF